MNYEDLKNRFSFHPAVLDDTKRKHELVREKTLELSLFLNELLPEGREKSMAVDRLEEVMMWSNAAIARSS